jgi:hypothetical protein
MGHVRTCPLDESAGLAAVLLRMLRHASELDGALAPLRASAGSAEASDGSVAAALSKTKLEPLLADLERRTADQTQEPAAGAYQVRQALRLLVPAA